VIVWVVVWETTGTGLEGVVGGWGAAGGSVGCGAVPGPAPAGGDGAGVSSEDDCGAGTGLPVSTGWAPVGAGGVVVAPDGGVVLVSLVAGGVLLPLLLLLVPSVDVAGGPETGVGEVGSTGVDAGGLGFVAAGDGDVGAIPVRPGVVAVGDALGACAAGDALVAAAAGASLVAAAAGASLVAAAAGGSLTAADGLEPAD
jgi:hypothetical protein